MALLQFLQPRVQIVQILLRKRLEKTGNLGLQALSGKEGLGGSIQKLAADGDFKGASDPASSRIDKRCARRVLLTVSRCNTQEHYQNRQKQKPARRGNRAQ
jgi:hypothetical protein